VICIVAALGGPFSTAIGAETEFEVAPTELNPNFVGKEKKPWEEQAVVLPPYPENESASTITLPIVGTDYIYTMDLDALSADPDGVIRYSIAVTAPTGISNLFYEGMRCLKAEYKTYAYGNQGKWNKAVYAAWRRVTRGAGLDFRRALYQGYFCDEMSQPFDRQRIVELLKETDR